ncbi:heat shock 70 kDa protein 12B-like isoform X2 [Mercenaria mercenaria]|uniref:heat shock 70 kDa protein 12B-like isoform X2 n=1 Tax=Mercenaria mercenaria TaxID=6596 RepID=UPI00234F1F29|nr:heat shock 70 kDa protein 12B-like isoform X2 [Mercenaria mercenaria]
MVVCRSKRIGVILILIPSLIFAEAQNWTNNFEISERWETTGNSRCWKHSKCYSAHTPFITATSSSSYMQVAAFDFGTTYSGYAFTFRHDSQKAQTYHGWNAGSEKLISMKTPTCILLSPDRKFHSFGSKAENKYSSLAEDDQHKGWLLFRHFKEILDNNENLSRETIIEDISGVTLQAMTIFTMFIRYLREHLIEAVTNQTSAIEVTDLQYVFTVPAIWNDNAKQFMREAAQEAGIDESRLKLCLVPASASVLCQIVSTDEKTNLSKSGTQYMVVDLGGGTANISVHEKLIDGSLKEIHKASGGPWGGNTADNNYLEWLIKIFGKETMHRFKNEQMTDYSDLFREFEIKTRNITLASKGKIIFRVPVSLTDMYQTVVGIPLRDIFSKLGLNDRVTLIGDKLAIDASIVINFSEILMNNIIAHVKEILSQKKMKQVDPIVLVGGFAENEFVLEKMRKKIKNKRIILADESGLVVLKGAVRFGHFPDVITTNILSFMYGIDTTRAFSVEKHVQSKILNVFGKNFAKDLFEVKIRAKKEIKSAQKYSLSLKRLQHISVATSDRANGFTNERRVYGSKNERQKYVTGDVCKVLGKIKVNTPESKRLKDRHITATLVFENTKLLVKVKILETDKEFTKHIDCL